MWWGTTEVGEQLKRPSTVTDAQLVALERLAPTLAQTAYLGGGVAIALRYGHRSSVDLDLFTPEDPIETSLHALERMPGVTITNRKPGTLYLMIDGIAASILEYDYPNLAPPERIEGVAVPLASIPDLVTMKLSAISQRGACRDFWDLHELMVREGITLDAALELQRKRYPQCDIGHVVRSLVYFADADASPRPVALSEGHWETIKSAFRSWVRDYATR